MIMSLAVNKLWYNKDNRNWRWGYDSKGKGNYL